MIRKSTPIESPLTPDTSPVKIKYEYIMTIFLFCKVTKS